MTYNQDRSRSGRYKWFAMFTVASGTFVTQLSSTSLVVGLPTITKALNTDIVTVQWIVLAHLLTSTITLLAFGRLADRVGRRYVYSLGFIVFALGSVLAGLSNSVGEMIGFRVLQGLGGGMTDATGVAIIASSFPREERGKAMGIWATVSHVGITTGPTIGGFVVSTLGWQWVFFVNVPFAMLAATLSMIFLKEVAEGERRHPPFDYVGALSFAVALSTFLIVISRGQVFGWASPASIVLIALSGLGFAVFVIAERRASDPMLDLRMIGRRFLLSASGSHLIFYVSASSMNFLMPFYLQNVLGFSPALVGIALMARPIPVILISPFAGRLSDKIGTRAPTSIGLALCVLSFLLFTGFIGTAVFPLIMVFIALIGIGQAMFLPSNNNAIMSFLPRSHFGVGGAIQGMMRNTGQLLGTAVSGTALATLSAYYADLNPGGGGTLLAFRDTFLVIAGIILGGTLLSLARGKLVEYRGDDARQPSRES